MDEKRPLREEFYDEIKGGVADGVYDYKPSLLFCYREKCLEPQVFSSLGFRQKHDSALALLLYDFEKESNNPIMIDAFCKYYGFRRYEGLSKKATEKYRELQESDKEENQKIVASLLGAPLLAIDSDEIPKVIESLFRVKSKIPHSDERIWLDRLIEDIYGISMNSPCDKYGIWKNKTYSLKRLKRKAKSKECPTFVLSHVGKTASEEVLWRDNGTREGIWIPYKEVSKKLPHAVKGPRKIPKIYYPYEGVKAPFFPNGVLD